MMIEGIKVKVYCFLAHKRERHGEKRAGASQTVAKTSERAILSSIDEKDKGITRGADTTPTLRFWTMNTGAEGSEKCG
jgi:hypothetical protein